MLWRQTILKAKASLTTPEHCHRTRLHFYWSRLQSLQDSRMCVTHRSVCRAWMIPKSRQRLWGVHIPNYLRRFRAYMQQQRPAVMAMQKSIYEVSSRRTYLFCLMVFQSQALQPETCSGTTGSDLPMQPPQSRYRRELAVQCSQTTL